MNQTLNNLVNEDKESPFSSSSDYGTTSYSDYGSKANRRRSVLWEKKDVDDDSGNNTSIDDITVDSSALVLLEKQYKDEPDSRKKEYLKELIKKEKVRLKKEKDELVKKAKEDKQREKDDVLKKQKIEKESQKEALKKDKELKKRMKEDAAKKQKEEKGSKKKKKSNIPDLVTDCIAYLEHHGLMQEGICRVSGSATQIKLLRSAYEKGKKVELEKLGDPHTVAGLLKIHFRYGEPLLTKQYYEEWIAGADLKMKDRIPKFIKLVSLIPPENFEILDKLIEFLVKVHKNSAVNKMDAANLATMFGPNLLRSANEQDMERLLRDTVHVAVVVQTLILEYGTIFKKEEHAADTNSSASSTVSVESAKEKIFKTNIADQAILKSQSNSSSNSGASSVKDDTSNQVTPSSSSDTLLTQQQIEQKLKIEAELQAQQPRSQSLNTDLATTDKSEASKKFLKSSQSESRVGKAIAESKMVEYEKKKSERAESYHENYSRERSSSVSNGPTTAPVIANSWASLALTLQSSQNEAIDHMREREREKERERERKKKSRRSLREEKTEDMNDEDKEKEREKKEKKEARKLARKSQAFVNSSELKDLHQDINDKDKEKEKEEEEVVVVLRDSNPEKERERMERRERRKSRKLGLSPSISPSSSILSTSSPSDISSKELTLSPNRPTSASKTSSSQKSKTMREFRDKKEKKDKKEKSELNLGLSLTESNNSVESSSSKLGESGNEDDQHSLPSYKQAMVFKSSSQGNLKEKEEDKEIKQNNNQVEDNKYDSDDLPPPSYNTSTKIKTTKSIDITTSDDNIEIPTNAIKEDSSKPTTQEIEIEITPPSTTPTNPIDETKLAESEDEEKKKSQSEYEIKPEEKKTQDDEVKSIPTPQIEEKSIEQEKPIEKEVNSVQNDEKVVDQVVEIKPVQEIEVKKEEIQVPIKKEEKKEEIEQKRPTLTEMSNNSASASTSSFLSAASKEKKEQLKKKLADIQKKEDEMLLKKKEKEKLASLEKEQREREKSNSTPSSPTLSTSVSPSTLSPSTSTSTLSPSTSTSTSVSTSNSKPEEKIANNNNNNTSVNNNDSTKQNNLNISPNKSIPPLLYKAISYLIENGQNTNGIFEISANDGEVNNLYSKGDSVDETQFKDVHIVANLLKLYFSKMSPRLIPQETYDDLISATEIPDVESRTWFLQELLEESIPDKGRREILKSLCGLLYLISSNQSKTNMNSTKLGLIFGPLVLTSRNHIEKEAKTFATFIDDYKSLFGKS